MKTILQRSRQKIISTGVQRHYPLPVETTSGKLAQQFYCNKYVTTINSEIVPKRYKTAGNEQQNIWDGPPADHTDHFLHVYSYYFLLRCRQHAFQIWEVLNNITATDEDVFISKHTSYYFIYEIVVAGFIFIILLLFYCLQ